MSTKYERLPTSPSSPPSDGSRSSSPSPTRDTFPPISHHSPELIRANNELNRELQRRTERDPRFNVPKPSFWKRGALLVFLAALFWVALWARSPVKNVKPKVVHADRYSKDYKFRPAASPIITQRLKDGRVKLRGALANGGL